MRLLKSKKIAKQIQEEVIRKTDLLKLHQCFPQLRILSVGNDPSSKWFVESKIRLAGKLGISISHKNFSKNSLEMDIKQSIYNANNDPLIDGILFSLPLPSSFDVDTQTKLLNLIDPYKDVDCVTQENRGKLFANVNVVLPATTQSCILLAESNDDISQKNVVFIGTGNVGKPLYTTLMNRYSTFQSISICNVHTKNIGGYTRSADLIFSAVGKPNLITETMISANTTIIDAGISKVGDNYVGDVDIESLNGVECIVTPTPGGVGTLTTTMIMKNLMSTDSTMNKIRYHLGVRGGL